MKGTEQPKMAKISAKIVLKRIILGKGFRAVVEKNQDETQEIHFSMSSVFPNKDAEETVLKILSDYSD